MTAEKEKKIIRSAGRVGLATSVSRAFGYARDASLALVLGAGFGMDAFAVAFRLANLFRRLVAEGAMSAAFVPVFISYRKEHSAEELWEFVRKSFYTLLAITGLIVILEVIFAPVIVAVTAPGFIVDKEKFQLTVFLTRFLAPYLILIALTALLIGVLNSLGHFVIPALNPVLLNMSIIAATFSFARVTREPAIGVAYGVLIGGGFQLASQLVLARSEGMRIRPGFSLRHPAIRKIAVLLGPSVFGVGIVQINLLVDSLMASFLREGSVSHLFYADRVMELVLGVFVISVATVILPDMSQAAADRDMEKVKSTLLFSYRTTAFIAIPAMVGLILLAEPIIHVLFERGRFSAVDTARTAFALVFYALGICSFAAVRLTVSAFYATQDTKTPVRVALVALAVNAILNLILMHPLEQGGIALATSLASTVSVAQLLHAFQKRHGSLDWRQFVSSAWRILVAAGVLGAACVACLPLFRYDVDARIGWKAAALFGTIAIGMVVYVATALILGSEELKEARKAIPFLRQRT